MIGFLIYTMALGWMTILVFWVVQKAMELRHYRIEVIHRRLRNEALEGEIETKAAIAAFYKARTWSEIRSNIRGAGFTDDELRRIEEMGLSNYIEKE